MSHVCPLLDVSNGAFLLEHSLDADGRSGTRTDHPAAVHISTYRSVPHYLAFLSQVTCTCFNLLHCFSLQAFSFFSSGRFLPINILVRSGMTSVDSARPIGWEWWVGLRYWPCCLWSSWQRSLWFPTSCRS